MRKAVVAGSTVQLHSTDNLNILAGIRSLCADFSELKKNDPG